MRDERESYGYLSGGAQSEIVALIFCSVSTLPVLDKFLSGRA